MDKTISNLVEQYCKGSITDAEYRTLKSWMDESEENREAVNTFFKLYKNYKAYQVFDQVSSEKGLDAVLLKVNQIKKHRTIRRIRTIAAVAVLLLASTFTYTWIIRNVEENEIDVVAQVVEPGEAKATLILGNGSQIVLDEIGDSTININDGAMISKNREVLSYQNAELRKEVMNTIRIPRGGEYMLVLSDGTKVWLNAASELTYPVNFLGKKRIVTLTGEGYFEVAKDAKHPFIVKTKDTEVKVLGTAFNIKAYPDENSVSTTLVEGQVEFYKSGQEENAVEMTPGMQGVILENGSRVHLTNVETWLYTSWKDGLFIFKNLSLDEIMKALGRWYDVEIEYETENLKYLHFTGDLRRYEVINTHLDMIGLTTDVKFELKDRKVYVRSY